MSNIHVGRRPADHEARLRPPEPPSLGAALRAAWHDYRAPRRRVWQVWHGNGPSGGGHPVPIAIRRTRDEAARMLLWAPDVRWAVDLGHPDARKAEAAGELDFTRPRPWLMFVEPVADDDETPAA